MTPPVGDNKQAREGFEFHYAATLDRLAAKWSTERQQYIAPSEEVQLQVQALYDLWSTGWEEATQSALSIVQEAIDEVTSSAPLRESKLAVALMLMRLRFKKLSFKQKGSDGHQPDDEDL